MPVTSPSCRRWDEPDPYGPPADIDLAAGTAQLPYGTATLTGIEDVIGSAASDTIRGDDGPNVIHANYGGDTIYGEGGDDTLIGGSYGGPDDEIDTIDGGAGTDTCDGETVTNCEA